MKAGVNGRSRRSRLPELHLENSPVETIPGIPKDDWDGKQKPTGVEKVAEPSVSDDDARSLVAYNRPMNWRT